MLSGRGSGWLRCSGRGEPANIRKNQNVGFGVTLEELTQQQTNGVRYPVVCREHLLASPQRFWLIQIEDAVEIEHQPNRLRLGFLPFTTLGDGRGGLHRNRGGIC